MSTTAIEEFSLGIENFRSRSHLRIEMAQSNPNPRLPSRPLNYDRASPACHHGHRLDGIRLLSLRGRRRGHDHALPDRRHYFHIPAYSNASMADHCSLDRWNVYVQCQNLHQTSSANIGIELQLKQSVISVAPCPETNLPTGRWAPTSFRAPFFSSPRHCLLPPST